jgi:hypothetical protein
VVQVFKNLERILDDVMGLGAPDVRHKPNATCVMLVGRRIQTCFLEMQYLGSRRHGALLKISE